MYDKTALESKQQSSCTVKATEHVLLLIQKTHMLITHTSQMPLEQTSLFETFTIITARQHS